MPLTLYSAFEDYGSISSLHSSFEVPVWPQERQILNWLSPSAPQERHQAVSAGRVDGVGDWLLQTNEFEKWHTGEDHAVSPVLFCYGNPGVGKTYLSSLVVDTLRDTIVRDNAVVAYVYCDFHFHEAQSATSVLAALLKQFVAGVEPMPEEVKKAFDRAKREVDSRVLQLHDVRAMLVKSLVPLLRGFICIDALDEFPAKHRPELWESLRYIVRECPNTRLFVTGRPHIREEGEEYFAGHVELISVKPTKEDIRGYLTMRLKNDLEPDAMDAELGAEILRIIPDRISGEFLLISLIMDAILEDATIHERRKTLHKMTEFFGLDDAYGTTLSRIREQKGNKARLGMEALMWITHSERPLKPEELCYALGVELGTTDLNSHNVPSIRTILSCALGLITIDEQASTVRLVHFTLREYLAAHPNLFVTPHSMMAEICLTYLNSRSVCSLSATPNPIQPTIPFIRYASCCWRAHAIRGTTKGVKFLALQLLEQYPDHISANLLLCGTPFGSLTGFTGLHCAAYLGIDEIATAMMDLKKWDLNGRDSAGATPLLRAARYRNYSVAKLLLEQKDVNPNILDNDGLTPLSWAAKSGEEALVKLLVERADVGPDSPDKYGQTPVSFAAGEGHEGVVNLLLQQNGVDPDSTNRDGRTPLSFAASSGEEGVVRLLLERTVNPTLSNNSGRTPLSFAASSGNEGGAILLLGLGGINPNSSDNYAQTPLLWAARSEQEGIVKLLLEREEVDPNASDIYRRTPLSWAAQSGYKGIVKLFLDRDGLSPNQPNNNGRTPLFLAAGSGHEDVVKLLLQRKDINPDSSDKNGRTPLSRAAMKGREGVVKYLLRRGDVNINSRDKDGRTPLSLAAMRGHEGVVKLLSRSEQLTPGLPQQVEKRTNLHPSVGSPEVAMSPQEPLREPGISFGIKDKATDTLSLPRPDISAPNTRNASLSNTLSAPQKRKGNKSTEWKRWRKRSRWRSIVCFLR